jgi:hypothetical protein
MLLMSFSTFSGSFFHEATYRRSGRFLDEAICQAHNHIKNLLVAVDDVMGFCYNGKYDYPWYFSILS